jgi:hypothetical protein
MASRFDIQIRLHFQGRQREGLVDSGDVLKLLDVVESAVYDSDRDDVIRAATALQIRSVERDACLERLRHYRHKRLLLEEARPGSLELIGLIAAVGYFVLEKTIGESFSDGYKNSELHRGLKEFFQRLIDEKALKIAESIRRVIASRKVQAQVRALPPADDNSPHTIGIDISPVQKPSDAEELTTLGRALE